MADLQVGYGLQMVETSSSFNKGLLAIMAITVEPATDLNRYLDEFIPYVKEKLLAQTIKRNHGLKTWVKLNVLFDKISTDDIAPMAGFLNSRTFLFNNEVELDDKLQDLRDDIIRNNDHFQQNKSGMIFKEVVSASINILNFYPLRHAGSYQDVPKYLEWKKAIVNVKNNDERCFMWSVLSALHPVDRTHQPNNKRNYESYTHEKNLDKLSYPVDLSQIPLMEEKINEGQTMKISLNVFGYHDDRGLIRYPIFVSKIKGDIVIDLLYWNGHFAWIKYFNRFMSDITQHNGEKYFCKACLGHFSSEHCLFDHQQYCEGMESCGQVFIMPAVGSILKFRSTSY